MNKKIDKELKDLELQLAKLDVSDQSEIRDSLRYELQQRIAARCRGTKKSTQFFGRFAMFRRPLPALASILVLAVAILAIAHPQTLAKLARYISEFRIGENTVVYNFGYSGDAEIDSVLASADQQLETGRMYMIYNEYGAFGGGVPEDEEPVIKEIASLSIARQMVDFSLRVPTYYHERIPDRYRFRKAQITPDGSAIFYFGIGPFETMIHYTPVGVGMSVASSKSVMTTDSSGRKESRGLTPQFEELDIQGRKVFWEVHDEGFKRLRMGVYYKKFKELETGQFRWEDNGVSYLLDGKTLTKDEGIKIIKSMKVMPVPK